MADLLGTSVPSVNSVLQRARRSMNNAERRAVPWTDDEQRVVQAFVAAFVRADVPALVDLLTDDVRFTMPPVPAWFDGRADVAEFLAHRVFATPWRVHIVEFNGAQAMVCYQVVGGVARLGAVNVLRVNEGLDRVVPQSGPSGRVRLPGRMLV